MPSLIESPLTRLTPEQIDQIGREFDVIHDQVKAELGERDRKYITSMIEMHRRMVVLARVLLFASRYRPAWVAGTTMLSLAKILENMEIGHNVMHGQWDWMNDHTSTPPPGTGTPRRPPRRGSTPTTTSTTPTPTSAAQGPGPRLRDHADRPASEVESGLPVPAVLQPGAGRLLRAGVAAHDLDFDAIKAGQKSKAQIRRELKGMARKGRQQITEDYIAFPMIGGLVSTGVELALAATRSAQARKSRPRRMLERVWEKVNPTTSNDGIVRQLIERRSFASRFAPRSQRTSPPALSATCGPTRSSSAGTSPTRPTSSARKRPRRSRAGRTTGASCSAPRTSRAARSVHTAYTTAPMVAAAGSVRVQAPTMLPATPHRTADRRLAAPEPMIEGDHVRG